MIKNKQGFTLIELLVVITIIGLLSTLAVFSLNAARLKARDAKRMNDVKIISEAVEMYSIDNGEYPLGASVAGYGISDCGSDGVLDYFDDEIGDYTLCFGKSLHKGDSVYVSSIPDDPNTPLSKYYYDSSTLNYPAHRTPCVYGFLEEKKYADFEMFFCQSGNCQIDDASFFVKYYKSCYGSE